MTLDYVALGILIFVVLILFYGIIAIHDIPYEIAKKRNHPQQDALHVAGWISLFTLHVLWPFLWIWATLWREDRGWGFSQLKEEQTDIHHQINSLTEQVHQLQTQLAKMTPQSTTATTPAPTENRQPIVMKNDQGESN
ncbi:DUF3302 domain-containing protein [Vibrio sp. S17_S38]|uniref:DUF3302 domain-containing protein n=1 Tax=Vibrio sp. S17_S38 TaxID=2720229 RepID=UPI00168002FE|nr:DUF3302 domain-containing protein [Vibrio sp. S17_S38]MBD1572707.1 DUF3302 domain-containing protein [Vibrio sp. S17_S38]